MSKLRVLDLFSGIGGVSLGLERTGGFETVAFCEIEAFPRKVLAKHWPNVPCYPDVRELTAERLAADGIAVDVICGGFPCQDISAAGKGAGLAGERSGLFYEVARLVGELGPQYVILENVSALLYRGLDAVLGALAEIGYDAEWHCIPASAVGAPHRRDRVWIVAHPQSLGHRQGREAGDFSGSNGGSNGSLCGFAIGASGEPNNLANAKGKSRDGRNYNARIGVVGEAVSKLGDGCGEVALAYPARRGRQGSGQSIQSSNPAPLIQRQAIDAFHGRVAGIWSVEPNVGRVANGVPDRSHRLKALGNAVVPQIPELIGNAILDALNMRQAA